MEARPPTRSIYHASKWGLEGFSEALNQEVTELGIRVTIVEPGGMRTDFGPSTQFTQETEAYRPTAVGTFRRVMANAGDDVFISHPANLPAAVFDTTRSTEPPLRLALGPDAYDQIHQSLSERLASLEAQEDLARSVTDRTATDKREQ